MNERTCRLNRRDRRRDGGCEPFCKERNEDGKDVADARKQIKRHEKENEKERKGEFGCNTRTRKEAMLELRARRVRETRSQI